MMFTRVVGAVASLLFAASAFAMQPPAPQTEFIPIDKLPPSDQLPSAPLLVAAYAFVWIAVMFYLWTIWRRLNKVEADMRALEQRSATGRR
jgi:CcmD family protein